MQLLELIEGLPIRLIRGEPDRPIADVTDDSRQVVPGALFIARRGSTVDGAQYVHDAIDRGAAAVLTEPGRDVPDGVTQLHAPDVRAVLAPLAERFFGEPARRLRLAGVTGTNGKTTTAFMARHLLQGHRRRCGLIGTIEIDDGRDRRPALLTTPGAIELSRLLARMVDHGCDACVMEVSSHALHQGRVDHLPFHAAAFTNLTGDHLDYHGTVEAYAAAKARLFERVRPDGTAIVNGDDPMADRMVRDCPATVWRFRLADEGTADYRVRDLQSTAAGSRFTLVTEHGSATLHLPLVGRHNVANMVAAIAVAEAAEGVEPGGLIGRAGFADLVRQCPPVPGRLEPVVGPEEPPPFTVLVDYAHTDDALRNVLASLRPITRGRLRVLFGCGGDRDRTKRPRMAAVACDLADHVVVTPDNPRTEDPGAIIEDIMAGVEPRNRDKVDVEPDRRAAIRAIVAAAGPGDVVLIAGKGHEDYQIVGAERRRFDDRVEARQALAETGAVRT